MATWLGEIKCPECGYWQIPMLYCPACGFKWHKGVVCADNSIEESPKV